MFRLENNYQKESLIEFVSLICSTSAYRATLYRIRLNSQEFFFSLFNFAVDFFYLFIGFFPGCGYFLPAVTLTL